MTFVIHFMVIKKHVILILENVENDVTLWIIKVLEGGAKLVFIVHL